MKQFNCTVSSDCPAPMMCYASVSGAWDGIDCYCNVYYMHEWDTERQRCLFKGPIANVMLIFSIVCLLVTSACLPVSFAVLVRLIRGSRNLKNSDSDRGLKVVLNMSLAAFASLLAGVGQQVAYLLERMWVDGMTFHISPVNDMVLSDVLLYRNFVNLFYMFSLTLLISQILSLWISQVEMAGSALKEDRDVRVAKAFQFWMTRFCTVLFGTLMFISIEFLLMAVTPVALVFVVVFVVLGRRLISALERSRQFIVSHSGSDSRGLAHFDRSKRMIRRHTTYVVGMLSVMVPLLLLLLTSPFPGKDPNDSRRKIHFSYLLSGCWTLLPVSGFLVSKEYAQNVMTRRNSRASRVAANSRIASSGPHKQSSKSSTLSVSGSKCET